MTKMKFAPIYVPLKRRLETAAALGWILFLVIGGIFGWLFYLLLLIFLPILRIPLLIYLAVIYFDRHAGELGYRRISWARKIGWWKHLTDYFPAKLVKTVDLPSDKNYLLATFPHGVLCFGAFCAFGADFTGFETMFPGLTAHILVLASHFYTPLCRELALSVGSRPSSATCIRRILNDEKKGQAVSLMVGGATEAMLTRPGRYVMYVKERKGFVRLALETGASLVPVISFGEPELYDMVEPGKDSLVRKIQEFIKRKTGLAPLLFNGRGIFQYTFGLIPRRHPLSVVVGKPIDVEKMDVPTAEAIEELHKKFMVSLEQLFNEEKSKYVADDVELLIM